MTTNRREFFAQATAAGMAAASAHALAAPSKKSEEPSRPSMLQCAATFVPMKDVRGKVAFITGGSSGIGLGIARAFVDAGMKVVIGYRTKSHLDEALKYLEGAGNQVHAIDVDVIDRPGIEKAAAETVAVFGKVHVLVNNAGVQQRGDAPLWQLSYDEWDRLMGVNLGGVFNGIRAFVPHIKQHGEGGQIITTSSIFGLFTPGSVGAYCAGKFAATAMAEVLRAELAASHIGVSALCPGFVKSNLGGEWLKEAPFALDPLEIGRATLRGMQNNNLYILTHPEYDALIQARNDAIMASSPKDSHPDDERQKIARGMLQESIYPVERDRQLCI